MRAGAVNFLGSNAGRSVLGSNYGWKYQGGEKSRIYLRVYFSAPSQASSDYQIGQTCLCNCQVESLLLS